MSRPRVAYFYDSEIGNYHYGQVRANVGRAARTPAWKRGCGHAGGRRRKPPLRSSHALLPRYVSSLPRDFLPPQSHPMKPHRVRMAHNLIVNYNLYKEMDVFVSSPLRATPLFAS